MSSPTVVLTRRAEDCAALASSLRAHGLGVLVVPCVRTEPLADPRALADAIAGLSEHDLLVLTSRNGVDAVAHVAHGPLPCRVAVVGPATGERARAAGFEVALTARTADSRVLGARLPIPRGRVVLARSDLADRDLPRILRDRGAAVVDVAAYRTIGAVDADLAPVRAALREGGVTCVFASPSAVHALVDALGAATLRTARFVAFGARTASAVRDRIGASAEIPAALDNAALARAIARPEVVRA